MSPIVVASLITAGPTLTGVVASTWLQTRRINTQNRAALEAQTEQITTHLKGDAP